MVVLVGALALFLVLALVLRRRNGRFTSRPARSGGLPPKLPAQRATTSTTGATARSTPSTSTTGRTSADGTPAEPASPLAEFAQGERATLVQFSSAFCAPCRATRRTLAEVSEAVPGVAHVEIDAESHLELVRTLNILRTPTTIVVDADGTEVARASGAPTKPQVIQALGNAV